MKKRRYRMTQPKFFNIWMKRLAVLLCGAVLLGIIGMGIAIHYYRSYVAMDYDMKSNELINQIEDWHNEIYNMDLRAGQMRSLWETAIHWVMDHYAENEKGGISIQMYREDGKQVYLKRENVSYIMLADKNGSNTNRIYECPNDILKKVFDEYDRLAGKNSQSEDRKKEGGQDVEIYMDDIYLSEGKYIPGKVELRKWNSDTENDYTTVKEFDFTPVHTEMYQHIEVDKDGYRLLGPLRFSGDEQDAIADQLLQDYTQKDMWNGEKVRIGEGLWDGDQKMISKTFGGTEYLTTQSRNIGGMIQTKIVITAHYNFFKDYGILVVWIAFGLIVLTIVISLLIAYYTYMIQKNRYDMEMYRRETTNAMAHDLKTPLTAISGYAENLVNKVHTEKTQYYCEAILENARYMDKMVANILELAKAESIQMRMKKETVSMYTLTTKCKEKYAGLLEDAKLQLHIQGDSIVKADGEAMMQVMDNLIGNAIKYAKEKTVIEVVLTERGVCISNTMAAKPDVPVEELVKPFVKGDNSRNGKRGNGIGLAIVKQIVENSGYHLSLRCEDDIFMVEIQFA